MHIEGKLGLKELKDCFIAFVGALIVALIIWVVFSILNLMSWVLCWIAIAVVFTPIVFWAYRWLKQEITIEDNTEEEIETFIKIKEE